MADYDSRPETYQHIERVRELLLSVVADLLERAHVHDRTKLYPPEVEAFDTYTPLLGEMTYGSDEYRECLRAMKPALEHHYEANRHHPEHFGDEGVRGMTLVDLIEMLCDWKAASERMKPRASLDSGEMKVAEASPFVESVSGMNAERFGYDGDLARVLANTAAWIEGAPASPVSPPPGGTR